MGNWTTVQMDGTCDEGEVAALKAACDPGADYRNFHCLSSNAGIFGLSGWPQAVIRANGNLAERDYNADSVAEQLRELVRVAPSLTLKVHVGGDNESLICVATVTVKDGEVTKDKPEIEALAEFNEQDIKNRVLGALYSARQGGC